MLLKQLIHLQPNNILNGAHNLNWSNKPWELERYCITTIKDVVRRKSLLTS